MNLKSESANATGDSEQGAAVADGHPMGMEDAVWRVLLAAIEEHTQIVVDDFHLMFAYATACNGYPRSSWYETER